MIPDDNSPPGVAPFTRRAFGLGLALGAAVAGGGAATAAITPANGLPGPWTSEGYIQRAGGKLHYVSLGEGAPGAPPIVLLHKLGGWVSDWRFVAPGLAQARRVIAFDLPGHGDSKWLGDAPYIQTLEETAAMLVAAWDELGVAQVDLVGTSLGGCVSAPLAALFPQAVRKLVLLSSALTPARSRAQIIEAIDKPEAARYANGEPFPVRPEQIAKTFGIIHADTISAEETLSDHQAARWMQPSERGVARADILGYLKRVQAPTLLLYGDHDPDYIKFRPAAEAALKDGRTAFVPQAGAFTLQDNPDGTVAVLNRFLG